MLNSYQWYYGVGREDNNNFQSNIAESCCRNKDEEEWEDQSFRVVCEKLEKLF